MSKQQSTIGIIAVGPNEGYRLKCFLRSVSAHVPVELLRLGRREGFAKVGHMLLGKIAETAGILRIVAAKVMGSQGAIFYK